MYGIAGGTLFKSYFRLSDNSVSSENESHCSKKKKRQLLCLNLRRTSNKISLHNNMNRSSPFTTYDHPWLVTER